MASKQISKRTEKSAGELYRDAFERKFAQLVCTSVFISHYTSLQIQSEDAGSEQMVLPICVYIPPEYLSPVCTKHVKSNLKFIFEKKLWDTLTSAFPIFAHRMKRNVLDDSIMIIESAVLDPKILGKYNILFVNTMNQISTAINSDHHLLTIVVPSQSSTSPAAQTVVLLNMRTIVQSSFDLLPSVICWIFNYLCVSTISTNFQSLPLSLLKAFTLDASFKFSTEQYMNHDETVFAVFSPLLKQLSKLSFPNDPSCYVKDSFVAQTDFIHSQTTLYRALALATLSQTFISTDKPFFVSSLDLSCWSSKMGDVLIPAEQFSFISRCFLHSLDVNPSSIESTIINRFIPDAIKKFSLQQFSLCTPFPLSQSSTKRALFVVLPQDESEPTTDINDPIDPIDPIDPNEQIN